MENGRIEQFKIKARSQKIHELLGQERIGQFAQREISNFQLTGFVDLSARSLS